MKRIVILITVLAIGFGAGIGLVFFPNIQEAQQTMLPNDENIVESVSDDPMYISFSHNDTFYDKTIEVEISCLDTDAELYYSLDGSTPDSSSRKYTAPITVKSGSKVNATTIKVIAIDGEKTSQMQTKSYITGKNVFDRFDDSTYVFVLSTDPYNLYDYYYGVCVEGYVRDQWLENEYKGGEIPYNAPANWYISGRESERDMYVEVYDSKGNQLINQAAGGRVVGGYSRVPDHKSWRLIARNEYSEGNGKFKYAFFSGATDAYGILLTRFDRITLRNNANDREFASVRDEIASQLAKNAGFPDIQETVPAAVFLNGEYYGFAWLHEAYCNDYLEGTYGGIKENFRIVDGKESEVSGDDEQSENDYYYMYELAESGLTDDKNFEEFCSLVDIDNFMLYYAIQIYINNEDWPGNNFKAWRYYPSEDEEITSPYLDGKWRFMLFDAEYGMGLYGNGYREPTLSYVLNGRHMQGASLLLNSVLERDDMKIKFADTVCDLMYGELSYENAIKVIEEKITLCDKECMYALENGYTSTWANKDTFADSRQQIRDFFLKRPDVVLRDITKVFEYDNEMYHISLFNGDGGTASLNSVKILGGDMAERSYFTSCSVPVKAEAYTGYKFAYWEVNGEIYEQNEFMITPDMVANDNRVNIKAFYEKISVTDHEIYISAVNTAGNSDSITIYNPNSNDIKLNGYCLSDKATQLDRWEIPALTIKGESELTVVCKNNNDSSALKKLVTNFNLNTGETVYLSDPLGNIISSVGVVKMNENQYIKRRDDGVYVIADIPKDNVGNGASLIFD